MFKILKIKVNKNTLSITDKNNNTYNVNIDDTRFTGLIAAASNRSVSIKNNIKYIEALHKIAWFIILICTACAVGPLLAGVFYAELPLLFYGGLGIGTLAVVGIIKLDIIFLKKYLISNEYWEQIYNQLVNDKETIIKSNNINQTYKPSYSYSKKVQTNNVNSTYKREESQQESSTYIYKSNQIIQDDLAKTKVKTYKRY